MGDDVKIEIGTSAWEMGRRFIEAWRAAERGEHREPERVLIYDDPSASARAVERMTSRGRPVPNPPHPGGPLAPHASAGQEDGGEHLGDD